jgi:hypothetical protein
VRIDRLVFMAVSLFASVGIWADTHTAASCSLVDVTAAYGAASEGDTVTMPAGTATWSNTLTLSKAITLQGAGISSTIVSAQGTTKCIDIALPADVFVRVTGIYFKYSANNLGVDAPAIRVSGKSDGSFPYTQIRIDHCKFEKSKRIVFISGWVYGVIDNNAFVNNDMAVYIAGDANLSWGRPIAAGTANALFIEDNLFTINNDSEMEPDHLIYHMYGARTVTRNNTFDGSSYTTSGKSCLFFDSHGNLNYYKGNSQDMRGQPLLEVYGNTFHAYRAYSGTFQIRSGSALIYGNDFMLETGTALLPYLYEEEQWNTSMFSPLRTEWPAEDNVVNTFIWDNKGNWVGETCDGKEITGVYVPPEQKVFIQENRDYFMHAPQATGGKSVYIGRPGASNTYPTDGGSNTTQFVAGGANAYYPYVAFIYPHPLRMAGNAMQSPQKLRIKQ